MMTELFAEISESTRKNANIMFDLAMLQPTPFDKVKMLSKFIDNAATQDEKDFLSFVFITKFEEYKIKNESNSSNQRKKWTW